MCFVFFSVDNGLRGEHSFLRGQCHLVSLSLVPSTILQLSIVTAFGILILVVEKTKVTSDLAV